MSEKEFQNLMAQLGMEQRRKVVNSLLSGNDTQCFTTEQYAIAYHKICHNNDPSYKDGWIKWLVKLAPKHLMSVGMVEVKDGIWSMPN